MKRRGGISAEAIAAAEAGVVQAEAVLEEMARQGKASAVAAARRLVDMRTRFRDAVMRQAGQGEASNDRAG